MCIKLDWANIRAHYLPKDCGAKRIMIAGKIESKGNDEGAKNCSAQQACTQSPATATMDGRRSGRRTERLQYWEAGPRLLAAC